MLQEGNAFILRVIAVLIFQEFTVFKYISKLLFRQVAGGLTIAVFNVVNSVSYTNSNSRAPALPGAYNETLENCDLFNLK